MTRRARGAASPLRRAVAFVSLLVVLLVPATMPAGVEAAGVSDAIEAARQRHKQIEASIERQQGVIKDLQHDEGVAQQALSDTADSLDAINTDQRQVRARIDKAQAALDRVQERHDRLVSDLRDLDWTMGLLQQELDSGAQDLEVRRQALGQRLAEAYRTQNTSLLEQVLTADSFTDVLSDTSAYLAYGDQDARFAAEIASDQSALDSLRLVTASTRVKTDQLRRAAVDAANEIKARKAELAREKARLARLEEKTKRIQERQVAAFHKIAATKAAAARILRAEAAAKRKLEAHIAGMLRAAQQKAARAGGGNGPWSWPVAGTITQEFGCTGFPLEPPLGSCAHFHDGIDIAGPVGTPIRAPATGVVAYIGWGYGPNAAYTVVLGHAGGLESGYAHLLPRAVVHVGQVVRRGQVIGYRGSTGNSTGPHLHFEVRRNGQPIDPRSLL